MMPNTNRGIVNKYSKVRKCRRRRTTYDTP